MAELARWVESVAATPVDNVQDSPFLYHTDWGGETKRAAAAIEVASMTGLDPKDIRPAVLDTIKGEFMLLDSGSCVCLEPAPPGLRSNGTPDPKIKLVTASGKPLVCYGK